MPANWWVVLQETAGSQAFSHLFITFFISFGQWFLKCGPWNSSPSSTWELVNAANSWTGPIKNLRIVGLSKRKSNGQSILKSNGSGELRWGCVKQNIGQTKMHPFWRKRRLRRGKRSSEKQCLWFQVYWDRGSLGERKPSLGGICLMYVDIKDLAVLFFLTVPSPTPPGPCSFCLPALACCISQAP